MASSPKQTGLNSNMAQPPLKPPSHNTYLVVDEAEDPKLRFRAPTARIIRFVLFWLTFVALLSFMIAGQIDRSVFTSVIFIELWFSLFWHLAHSLPQSSQTASRLSGVLPRISIQVGDSSYSLGRDGDNNHNQGSGGRPSKKNPHAAVAFIDFTFASTLIIFGALAMNKYIYRHHTFPVTMAIIVASLMLAVSGISTLSAVYHTAAVEVSIYKDGSSQPISLRSPTGDASSHRHPVSIAA